MTLRIVYSIGKGGVGKTTCAGALSLQSARSQKTLVVSLDPAHNLGDVLGRKLSGDVSDVSPNLWAAEVDMDAAIARYLDASTQKLKGAYSYLKTINIDGYLEAMKLSPGIEEYATLQVMEELIRGAEGRYDVVVFDTPPTGLTLRVLALPRVSLMWGERLTGLRREILDRRQIIKNIQGERKHVIDGIEHTLAADEKSDAVMGELREYVDRMRRLSATQADGKISRVMPVMNPDSLSLFETKRALATLRSLGMTIGPVLVNKVGVKATDEQSVRDIGRELGLPTRTLPFSPVEPVGTEALERLAGSVDFGEWIPGTP
ncbi:MAG: ArsA family ATPase [Dehalococcoidia bacterium]|nr:ArsA family ATPase [Dehalococcoidia bacterium]